MSEVRVQERLSIVDIDAEIQVVLRLIREDRNRKDYNANLLRALYAQVDALRKLRSGREAEWRAESNEPL